MTGEYGSAKRSILRLYEGNHFLDDEAGKLVCTPGVGLLQRGRTGGDGRQVTRSISGVWNADNDERRNSVSTGEERDVRHRAKLRI